MIKLNGHIVEQNHFPDGTLLIKEKLPHNDGLHVIQWKYENDAELFTIICLKRHIDSCNSNNQVKLIMNYIPHSRQDRVKREEDVFTLKYFSEILNSLNFSKVFVLDPHSSVSEALINNISVDCGWRYIEKVLKNLNDAVIYYPDNGAYKKYTDFIKLPACYGVKKRDWETGKILGLDMMLNGIDIKNKTVLMIDDIISYGGSMYYGAKKLKELGCGNIYIYASHVENSILDGELIKSDLFKKIYTTNSLFNKEHEKIEVFEL